MTNLFNTAMPENESLEKLSYYHYWTSSYRKSVLEQEHLPRYLYSLLHKEIWSYPPGKVFEVGCSSSVFLAKSAHMGWEVSGIDFHREALAALHTHIHAQGGKVGYLICQDLLEYDCSVLANTYDVLISFGLLEHFRNPARVLKKYSVVVKTGGKVVSMVPNLLSLNARFLKNYDPALWEQHLVITPPQLDSLHLDAGLKIKKSATYTGGYDLDMLIPWNRIGELCTLPVLKLLRYTGTVVGSLVSFKKSNSRVFNPILYGVYERS